LLGQLKDALLAWQTPGAELKRLLRPQAVGTPLVLARTAEGAVCDPDWCSGPFGITTSVHPAGQVTTAVLPITRPLAGLGAYRPKSLSLLTLRAQAPAARAAEATSESKE